MEIGDKRVPDTLSFASHGAPNQAPEESIGCLVGQVYDAAPAPERVRLIEHLLRPLSLMALLAVGNGVFAKLWFRRGWNDLQIRIEDTQIVKDSDIIALVDFVQQVSTETIDGIVQILSASPAMSATAAAALLLATLVRRTRSRHGELDNPQAG